MKSNGAHPRKRSTLEIFSFGLLAGLAGGVLVGRKLVQSKRMPYLDLWQAALGETRGDVESAVLAARAQREYEATLRAKPRLAHLALRLHLDLAILPGLAFYRVLLEALGDKGEALETIDALFVRAVEPIKEVVGSLSRFPEPFGTFRQLVKWALKLLFPAEGWQMETVEDSPRCIALDAHECFYEKMLEYYGAPELTAVYCRMDDVVFEALPESISWERSKTRATGGSCCDFRWRHRETQPAGD